MAVGFRRRMALLTAVVAVVTAATGCSSDVPLAAVDSAAIDADRAHLATIDPASLTPSAFPHRERVRAAEAYAVLHRLDEAAKPFCVALHGPCDARLKLVRKRAPDAFITETGQLTVSTGMIGLTRHEDELAFVMAHELGHRIAGHSDLHDMRSGIGKAAGFIVGAGIMTVAALSGTPMDRSSARELGRATDDLSELGGKAGAISYSERQELEADKLGLQIMNAAGYEPSAAIRVFELAALDDEKDIQSEFFGARGDLGERIAHLRVEIAGLPPPAPTMTRGRIVQAKPADALMVWSSDLSPLD